MTRHTEPSYEPAPDNSRSGSTTKQLEKMGWVSPVYSNSRSVELDSAGVLGNRCIAVDNKIPETEIYRILRSQILHRCEEGDYGKTIMVTSAVPQEGKTVTAINLAMTLAREFSQTALLVDCDFRSQQIHKTLCYESKRGLADYLLHDTPFSDIVVWPNIEKLTIISGGRPIGASSELLGSPGMRQLIADMKSRYPERFVIFDSPPVLTCSDTLALAPLVDGVVVVVRADKTSRTDILKALDMLPRDKILGLVLNQIPL